MTAATSVSRGQGPARLPDSGGDPMSRAPWGVPFVISLLLGGAAGAADSAVVAVGKCDESAGISARSFRTALSQKPGTSVQSEAETAQPFGGITDRTLASVNTAIGSA